MACSSTDATDAACLCDQCAALCCRYFALPLDNPKTARQFDDIRWYLMHENVVVFIEEKQWYIGIMSRCKHLQPDNRCGVYDIRPKICREYSTDNCDYRGGEYNFERLFTSADQLREYAKERLAKRRLRHKRRREAGEAPAAAGAPQPAPRRGRPSVRALPSKGRGKRKPELPLLNGIQNGNQKGNAGRNGHGLSLPVLRG